MNYPQYAPHEQAPQVPVTATEPLSTSPTPPVPAPMPHGTVTDAPAHDPVYPSGDPSIPAQAAPEAQRYDAQGIADFTPTRPRPTFRIGDDIFYGKIEIPTLAAMKYATRASALEGKVDATSEEEIEVTLQMLRLMLQKDSADLFIARLNDEDNGIGTETFQKILPWLMEQYGMRPTVPSSDSSDGSPNPDDGNSSTETSHAEVSTSSPSPSTGP